MSICQLVLECSYVQTTWNALGGRNPSAANEPAAPLGNVLIISKEAREAWLAIREACQVAEGFWDFVFEQADHGHLPDDMIKVDMEGREWMKGRWYRRAGNFRKYVEPLAEANLAYIDVNAVYSDFRPRRFLRIEHVQVL